MRSPRAPRFPLMRIRFAFAGYRWVSRLDSRYSARYQGHQVPGDYNRKQYVDARQQFFASAAPAVDAQRQGEKLHQQQASQGMGGVAEGEANQWVGFLDAVQQEGHGGQEIQHLQIRILDKQLIHLWALSL